MDIPEPYQELIPLYKKLETSLSVINAGNSAYDVSCLKCSDVIRKLKYLNLFLELTDLIKSAVPKGQSTTAERDFFLECYGRTSNDFPVRIFTYHICRAPADILRHIQQRLSDEGQLTDASRNILEEYIEKEEKYTGTILRSKKDWEPLPEDSPEDSLEEMKIAKLIDEKATEYKLYGEELGPQPTIDQMKKKQELYDELQQLLHQYCWKK
ncbi:hypothetical protein HCN44_001309 [Aphidius gifuensis]|uniref:Uncharacterized protein n=1 Tax=Aphidius gifuensis TaxID=684658 RepID=A0A834XL55_APHGI|nr:hypothetical protein HCN44_001309 [Aphidius gifuensis]